jgi:hypothetical protein
MRRLLKSIANGATEIGDMTTIEDETSLEEVRKTYSEMHKALNP